MRREDTGGDRSLACEVAIVGGGPAGAAAARRLVEDGHKVVVLTRPTVPGRALAESLPPSAAKLLRALALEAAVDRAGFLRSSGNTVWWGEREARVTSFPDGARGYQVDRAVFDEVLLAAARAAGATIRRGVVVGAIERAQGWSIRVLDEHGGAFFVEAEFVLDCSGRAGVLARGVRCAEPGARTLALVGAWTHPRGWPLADPTHTLVESYQEGWAWSVPRSITDRVVACMIDRRAAALRETGSLETAYLVELGKTRALSGLLSAAVRIGPVWACDATMYSVRRAAGSRHLLVGDAASFLDPLSSYGIKKALASAWLAATAVHTALVRPAMRSMAFDYFAAREALAYAASRAQAVGYFREAWAVHDHPFWRVRADLDAAVPWEEDVDVEALRSDPSVRAAFHRLRHSMSGRLRPTPRFRIDYAPAVVGREIACVPRLLAPGLPGGLRYLRGVEVPRVVELAHAVGTVPELFEAYVSDGRPASLPDFLGVVSVLLARGVLALVEDGG